jgi:hypothetical protein
MFAAGLLATAQPALAWIYPEHRDQATAAIGKLDPAHRALLDALWSQARQGHEARLCASAAAGDQGEKVPCIDLAAWPAIAGDHSCSAENMLANILDDDWILQVASLSAKAKADMGSAKREDQRRNALTRLDLGLERADREYSSRAAAGNAHFLTPRTSFEVQDYVNVSLRPGMETNAMALYLVNHAAALEAAAAYQAAPEADRPALARRVLALETFAAHFLEDTFAAGHIAGSWGSVAERKGTHDHYNVAGLETRTWSGQPMIFFGDAHMRAEDLERVSTALVTSLSQVLDALEPGTAAANATAGITLGADLAEGRFNACTSETVPDFSITPEARPIFAAVMRDMPIPFRGPGDASLPRFQAEIGPFVGLAAGGSADWSTESLDGSSGGAFGSLSLGIRVGVGLESLLTDSGDGLLFLEGAVTMNSREKAACGSGCTVEQQLEALLPSFPARSALTARVRAPFWLIPGDLIIAVPFLLFTSPESLKKMGITAANGGLIPWQTGLETSVGRFQFVLGREVAATFFGYWNGDDPMVVQSGEDPVTGRPTFQAVGVRTIRWDFPVLEYRPYRWFGAKSSQAIIVQLGFSADHPERVRPLLSPNATPPELETRYLAFLRIVLDARRYK